jgi:hypothetical protein
MNELKHVEGRIIASVDLQYKNWHTFSSGLKIRRERQYNELNRRITEPVNAIVIDAENIPVGSEILFHPNEIHDSNRIFNNEKLSGDETASSVKYYSLNEGQCFIWRENSESAWKPIKGFATGLRVFNPYFGAIQGILPEQIKNVLYITSGEYAGQICHTLKACDYEIIFQDSNGREGRIIRLRHYEGEYHDREEIIMVRHDLTNKLNNGELLIGLSPSDCKKLK